MTITYHEVCKIAKTPSFPRKAGIQTKDFNSAFLDSRRGRDEKTQLAHLVDHLLCLAKPFLIFARIGGTMRLGSAVRRVMPN